MATTARPKANATPSVPTPAPTVPATLPAKTALPHPMRTSTIVPTISAMYFFHNVIILKGYSPSKIGNKSVGCSSPARIFCHTLRPPGPPEHSKILTHPPFTDTDLSRTPFVPHSVLLRSGFGPMERKKTVQSRAQFPGRPKGIGSSLFLFPGINAMYAQEGPCTILR